MAETWIDRSVIADAATALSMSIPQALAWYADNKATVRLVRDYVETYKSPTPEDIESFADPNGPIPAELVAQIGALLQAGGLILKMED
jgi:hypothetical protein